MANRNRLFYTTIALQVKVGFRSLARQSVVAIIKPILTVDDAEIQR